MFWVNTAHYIITIITIAMRTLCQDENTAGMKRLQKTEQWYMTLYLQDKGHNTLMQKKKNQNKSH